VLSPLTRLLDPNEREVKRHLSVANAITALDPDEADRWWREANNIVSDDAALIPIVNDKAPYILAPYVSGFVSASEEWYDLTEVRLKQ